MTVYTHYLRCDECGVDPGKACRDDDDREALEVCDGRRLDVPKGPLIQSHRGLGRTPERMAELASRRATIDQRPQAVSRRARGILATPVMVPCICCGTQTRLWGAAVAAGRTWCSAPECQRHKGRERNARGNAGRPVPPTPPPLACHWCSSPVPRAGRDPTERACCGATACLEARRIGYRPHPVACHWCRAPVVNTGRDLSDRACCGEIGCVRMRIRTERAETRHRKAVSEKHQQHA